MIPKTLVLLVATAMTALLLWLLLGCTGGRGNSGDQQKEASRGENSVSRTSTNLTPPAERTATSEETIGGHQEARQQEPPCSSPTTRFAETRRHPDEHSRLRIAFSRYHNGVLRIYVIDADGTDQTILTEEGEANEVAPAWSPDGRKIAFETFAAYVYSGPYHVYVTNADGSGRTHLAETRGDAAGEYTTPTPAWSPDGKKITFAADNGIHVINADGSGETRLTKADDEKHLTTVDQYPTWSPDGKKIAFRRQTIDTTDSDAMSSADAEGVPERSGIYVINADGTGLKKLLQGSHTIGGAPTWSPDGEKIAFVAGQSLGIFVANVEGTYKTRPTRIYDGVEQSAVWQPTGEKIAFAAGIGFAAGTAIYTINADGSSVTPLDKTLEQGSKEVIAWSPDGKKIIFLSGRRINPHGKDINVNVAGDNTMSCLNSLPPVPPALEHGSKPLAASVSVVFMPEGGR
jgi:Tol biopolymer transport system component